MIKDIILAFISGILLYIGYIVSADMLYSVMQTEITTLADSYTVTNPVLKTMIEETYDILKTGYKLAIIGLWISICVVLIVASQRRDRLNAYQSYGV